LLATNDDPLIIIDGFINNSIYSLKSTHPNESVIIIRYHVDYKDLYSHYEMCTKITRYETNFINNCTEIHNNILSNTLNISNLMEGDYILTFSFKKIDVYNHMYYYYWINNSNKSISCDIPYLTNPVDDTISFLPQKSLLLKIMKFNNYMPKSYLDHDGIYVLNERNENKTNIIALKYYISSTNINFNLLSICYSLDLISESKLYAQSPSLHCSKLLDFEITIQDIKLGKFKLTSLIVENIEEAQTYISINSEPTINYLEVKNIDELVPIINIHKIFIDDVTNISLNILYRISGIPSTAFHQVKFLIINLIISIIITNK
jgi:hypothetical protein